MDKPYANKILIEFQAMVNLDFGLLKVIKDKYNNPKFFNMDLINCTDYKTIRNTLASREEVNPLTAMLNSEHVNEADELFSEFVKDEYENIIRQSEINDIFRLMNTYALANGAISVTVLCKDEIEESKVKLYDPDNKLKILICKENKDVNLDNYKEIFVKYFGSIFTYDIIKLGGKHIYMHRSTFNMEPSITNREVPILEYSVPIHSINKLYFIDPYPDMIITRKVQKENEENDSK